MLVSEKQLQVLEYLATYKYLTTKQLLKLELYSTEKIIRDKALTPLKKAPLNYIKGVDFGFYPSKGRLHSIHHLTKKGALVLEDTSKEEWIVFYPKGKVDFSRDYFHRVQFIDLHIALRQWAEATGQEVVFFQSYFDSSQPKQGYKLIADTQVNLFGKTLIPDGNFCLLMPDHEKRLFTLELHRGNNLKKILYQLQQHSQIIQQGLLADKYQHNYDNYVLSVYEEESTMLKVQQAITEKNLLPEHRQHFVFNSLDSVIASFGKKWHYANNTPFHHFNGLWNMTDLRNIKPEDLQNLNLGDFQKLQDMLAEAEKLRKKQDFEKTCLAVQETIDSSPFSVQEVFEALSKGKGKAKKKVIPKYHNTEDTSQTWTGRGRKPLWLVEALESGTKIEEFLIEHEKQESLLWFFDILEIYSILIVI